MIYALLSATVALACVAASVQRLRTAIAPIALHPTLLVAALDAAGRDGDAGLVARLRREFAQGVGAVGLAWENDLFAAFDETEPRLRDALVNEQLLELDSRTRDWARAPRVCASVAMSAGFLFGLLSLLNGLAVPAGTDEVQASLHAAMSSALAALSFGIAGASFCVAVHLRATRIARERLVAIDRLVERLGRLRPARPRS